MYKNRSRGMLVSQQSIQALVPSFVEIVKPQRLNTSIAFVLATFGIMLTELEYAFHAVVSGAFLTFSTSEHVCREAFA